jgi:nucleoside-diphosphate-sugar epimerase
MKVAVTGPNGWIAKALLKKLAAQSFDSVGVQRDWLPWPGLAKGPHLTQVFDDCHSLVHLAALVHQMDKVPTLAEYRSINCDLTLQLAQAAAAAGVRQFIFMSTAKVMGELSNRPFVESDDAIPVDAYSVSKFEAEKGLQNLHKSGQLGAMKVCIVRPPLVYGEGVGANYEKLISLANTSWPLPLGKATALRSMVSIDRLTDGISALVSSNEHLTSFEVFFAADPIDQSAASIIRATRQANNHGARLIAVPQMMMKYSLSAIGKTSIYERLFTSLQVDGSRLNALITHAKNHAVIKTYPA